jgi:predicted nucleotidyltransferase component of viral defense system
MELHGLTKNQAATLAQIAKSPLANSFYFTGGTALSAVYLHHRRSDDLDFFSLDEVDLPAITTMFRSFKDELGFTKVDIQTSLNRNLLFLRFAKNEILKTEFTYYPFKQITAGPKIVNLQVDSLKDIAVNKFFTLAQKPRSRDFIDLYFILQKDQFSMKALYYLAKVKFDWHIDPLQIGAHFLAFDESDMGMLYEPIEAYKIRDFFEKKALDLRPELLKP